MNDKYLESRFSNSVNIVTEAMAKPKVLFVMADYGHDPTGAHDLDRSAIIW